MKVGLDIGLLPCSGCNLAFVGRRSIFDDFDTMAVVSGNHSRHLLNYAGQTPSDHPFCILLTIEAFGFGSLAT
jgi:hypothetical protein